MTRLSSGLTHWYRIGAPILYLVVIAMFEVMGWHFLGLATVVLMAYAVWYGWRLSEVWLDGDALKVKGIKSFRVPLSDITVLDLRRLGRAPIVCILRLAGPIREIRFFPLLNSEQFRVFQAKFRTSHGPPG